LGEVDHGVCFLQGEGQWLLTEDALSGCEGRKDNFTAQVGRGGNLNYFGITADSGPPIGSEVSARRIDTIEGALVWIGDCDYFKVTSRAIGVDAEAAEGACANEGYAARPRQEVVLWFSVH
jgi:hypothetical protein